MDYAPLIEKKRLRVPELESFMAQDGFFDDPKQAGELTREYNRTKSLLEDWATLAKAKENLEENRLLAKESDPDMAEMAAEEIPALETQIEELEAKVQYALLPHDPTEDRDAIVEIRAGTGGDEASLFAGDLYRMYQRYAEARGWRVEPVEASPSEVGGYKEVVFKVTGEEVFRFLKYESGVHRVQRVPDTETQGRIHTSTATVAVLPEAEEVDVELRTEDLQIQATRAGGPGGQHVNTTDSAVQVTHLPTGIQVKCQDGRSQGKNKEKALQILRAKLLEAKIREEHEKYSAHRKNLIGSGGREEKIRTYNFPQNRLTDHRVNMTLYNLDSVMTGDLEETIGTLQASEMEDRLAELEEGL
ncbi:peptide chain release factor 1 [Verrucomicrobiales bacterium]|nr:peptide chain release factor 1 [Verrucomicrobiales bacterium]MDB2496608.1 peptide chain release factor 1 [Verrucomicrobiales bacterium]MDB2642599.1 peptide chain release factor 1 [bacterium]MDB3940100.1 peptide chain release factor 1 [Verrucomicrobiales bacterium]